MVIVYLIFGFIALIFSIFLIRQCKQIKLIHKAISDLEREIEIKEVADKYMNRAKDERENEGYIKELVNEK